MLAAIHDKVKGIVATIVLLMVGIPFVLWGINSYFESGPSLSVAKFGSEAISQREYRSALDQFRSRMDAKALESPQFKRIVLDGLLDQHLLLRDAEALGFRIGDAALGVTIRQLPYFQRNGRFDNELYEGLLRREGIRTSEFEQRLRGEMVSGQVKSGLVSTGFVTTADTQSLVSLIRQQRDIEHALIRSEPIIARMTVSFPELEQYYAEQVGRYMTTEQVRVEYVKLSAKDIADKINLTEEDLRKAYAAEGGNSTFEKRRPELLKQLRAHKAEERLFELTERFQTLVYEHPDSLTPAAEALGLSIQKSDWFTRTGGSGIARSQRVVDSAFGAEVLNQARNSDPVETGPGEYVALRLIEHRPAARRPLTEVRAQIERELKLKKATAEAQRQSKEIIQTLRAGNSLAKLSAKYGFVIARANAVTREKPGALDPRLVDAAFRATRPDRLRPTFGSVELGSQGVAIYAVTRVQDADSSKADAALIEKTRRQLLAHRSSDYYNMYRAGLRQKTEIKVFADRL